MSRIKQLNTIITDAPLSIAILAVNVRFQLVPELITYYTDLHLMIFFLSWYIYRAVTRARACVVRRSNVLECLSTMTRMFCSMHAGLLDGRCIIYLFLLLFYFSSVVFLTLFL